MLPSWHERKPHTSLAPSIVVDSSVPMMDLTAHSSTDNQSPPKKKAKNFSEEDLIMGQELSDLEINFAQELLKGQYPKVSGLQSTLFQERIKLFSTGFITSCIQIIHCKMRHHWVTASTSCELQVGSSESF